MASKIDKVLDRLEVITREVNDLKRKGIPLLPVPPAVKSVLRTGTQRLDDVITDTYFDVVRGAADIVLPANVAMEVINNPNVLMDSNGSISQITSRPGANASVLLAPAAKKPRKVTKKMKMQRKIQSTAFRNANAKGRKKDGTFRSGFDQSRIASMAQKECTKERQRLGLCEKPKRRSTRKGQVRKTARRAFE
jgi:hypothetical protein